MPVIPARAGVLAGYSALVLARAAKQVRLGIQKLDQRILNRRMNHFVPLRPSSADVRSYPSEQVHSSGCIELVLNSIRDRIGFFGGA